jgi:hypothetical protein
MQPLSKILIFLGIFITFVGLCIYFGTKIGIPFGKIPGDIHIQKEKYSIYFPVIMSIMVSIFLTIILNLFFWIFRK